MEEALAANGLQAWQARGIGELYAWFDEHPGTAGAVTDVVASLGGHPPRTLDGFIKEFKDRFEPEPVEPEYVEYQDGTFAD